MSSPHPGLSPTAKSVRRRVTEGSRTGQGGEGGTREEEAKEFFCQALARRFKRERGRVIRSLGPPGRQQSHRLKAKMGDVVQVRGAQDAQPEDHGRDVH